MVRKFKFSFNISRKLLKTTTKKTNKKKNAAFIPPNIKSIFIAYELDTYMVTRFTF